MNLTELLQGAQTRMLDAAAQEEATIAASLPADRFCSDGCLDAYASDIVHGLVAGLPTTVGECPYCGDYDRTGTD